MTEKERNFNQETMDDETREDLDSTYVFYVSEGVIE